MLFRRAAITSTFLSKSTLPPRCLELLFFSVHAHLMDTWFLSFSTDNFFETSVTNL